MKRTKKFQWMAVMVTAMVMTCMTMTSCSVDDNPAGDEDVPGAWQPLQWGNWTYDILSDTRSCMITGYVGDKSSVTSITIPAVLKNEVNSFSGVLINTYKVTGFSGSFHFSDFPNLTTIEFESGSDYALTVMLPSLRNCLKLTTVNNGFLPYFITSIPNYCFTGTAIKKLEMPGVTSIGFGAFDGCPLESAKIYRSAKIEDGAFSNISDTCTIEYDGDKHNWTWRKYENSPKILVKIVTNRGSENENRWYYGWCGGDNDSSHNKVEWKINAEGIMTVTCTDNTTWDNFPGDQVMTTHRWTDDDECKSKMQDLRVERVTSICDGAFAGCTELTSATISASVTSIGAGAFAGCTKLKKIIIKGHPTIGDGAFPDGVSPQYAK